MSSLKNIKNRFRNFPRISCIKTEEPLSKFIITQENVGINEKESFLCANLIKTESAGETDKHHKRQITFEPVHRSTPTNDKNL